MPPRIAHASSGAVANTPYSLSLLSEYTHTLDSLPLDLSRNFADLRELDAVLSSSMSSITSKIHKLITMIEQNSSQKDERLWLLTEIAEEATRLKLGGEDKIRVACQAADSLKGHTAHMRSLLAHLPGFDAAAIVRRRTTYPHIAHRSFMPVAGMEGGRRRRGGFGSLLASGVESPTKRKRVVRDDDGEPHRSPRKDKAVEGSTRHRNTGGRTKRHHDRGPSPTESILSITSHQQPAHFERPHPGHSRLSQTLNARPSTNTTHKRPSRPPLSHHGSNNGNHHTQDVNDAGPSNGRREMFNAPPASSHPSLPLPFSSSTPMHYDLPLPTSSQLEGPGVPPVRAYANSANNQPIADMEVDEADGVMNSGDAEVEGDGEDEARYCYCHGVSHGEMVGCDGEGCTMAWFHLGCIGLSKAPEGNWYCNVCKVKERSTSRRGGRGGRRRAGGRAAKGGGANTA